jgi:hypothetical protein
VVVAKPENAAQQGDSSDEEATLPTRSTTRGKNGEGGGREELDSSHLIGTELALKKFRRTEKRRGVSHFYYLSSCGDIH